MSRRRFETNPGNATSAMATAALSLLLAALTPPLHARKLPENLRLLGNDAGKRYMDPAVSSFGAAMNTGWFHRAPDRQMLGLDIDFGVISVAGLFVGAPKHFESSGSIGINRLQAAKAADSLFGALQNNPRVSSLSQAQKDALRDTLRARISGSDIQATFRGPTAVGPNRDSLYINLKGVSLPIALPAFRTGDPAFDTTLAIPAARLAIPAGGALAALPFIPILAPSVTIGTAYATQATIRWLPKTKVADDVSELGIFGFGVQHNLAYWIGPAPLVDLTLDAHGQWLDVENTFTSRALSGGAMVSKSFGSRMLGITPFAGAGLERSEFEVDVDAAFDAPAGNLERKVKFKLYGRNQAHFTLGCAFQLFHVNLTADYNFAEYDTFTANAMVML
jgi:hypothetical protein